jgi:hypothetical protein
MAKVESKTNMNISIEVRGKNGDKKGHLNLTSGNVYYYRVKAKNPTAVYTYQQLISLIEEKINQTDEDE